MSYMKNKISFASVIAGLVGLLILPVVAAVAATAPAAPGGSGLIPVTYEQTKRINVSVVSTSPEIAVLMQNAFALHGGFDSTNAAAFQYILHFDPAGANKITATIEPKTVGGTSYSVTVTAATAREAAYRAGDAVVEKFTQLPGFFAGKLAFVSERTKAREIWTSDLLGQQTTQLTADKKISAVPRWSPDGMKLLYTGYYRTGFPDVILFDLATQKRTVFADYQGTNTGGTFSPDGKSVAMILSTKDGGTELFVGDAAGNNLRRLTHEATSKASPTWSPDGQRIAIADDARGGHPLIFQIPATGGALRAVQTNISNYCADPAWNPRDPNQVAFMAEVGTQLLIAVYSFKDAKTTVFDAAEGSDPCWLNDGRHLVFTHRSGGMDNLWILDTFTKKLKQLTKLGASEAAWVYVK